MYLGKIVETGTKAPALRATGPSLHPGAALGGAAAGPAGASARDGASCSPATCPSPGQPAVGVPLPDPLLEGPGDLRQGGAGPRSSSRRTTSWRATSPPPTARWSEAAGRPDASEARGPRGRPGARSRPTGGPTRAIVVSRPWPALTYPLMPQPPILTPEQRKAALAKAAIARKERAELKDHLKTGRVSFKELLGKADGDDIVGKMKVARRPRVPARHGQGQGPAPHGAGRDQRDPPPPGPRCQAA